MTEAIDSPDLDAIKRLVVGKRREEVLAIREDILTHIRSLDPKVSPWPESHKISGFHQEAVRRLERHNRELAFLNGLLG